MKIAIMSANNDGFQVANFLKESFNFDVFISLSKPNKSVAGYKKYREQNLISQAKLIEVESLTISSAEITLISQEKLDLLFVVGWPKLLSKEALESLATTIIGFHGSPWGISQGRGRSPQNWAIILGSQNFLLSSFILREGIDDGPIISEIDYAISSDDDIFSLHFKTNYYCAQMIYEIVSNRNMILNAKPQKELSEFLPKRIPDDGFIDFSDSVQNVHNLIRALADPYPNARFIHQDILYFVKSSIPIEIKSDITTSPGTIIEIVEPRGLVVSVLNGWVYFKDIHPPITQLHFQIGEILRGKDRHEILNTIIQRHYSQLPTNQISSRILKLVNQFKNRLQDL